MNEKVPVQSIYNHTKIIAEAEEYYEDGKHLGTRFSPAVIRAILRDSCLFREDEIENWPEDKEIIAPIGCSGYERVVDEGRWSGLTYKCWIIHNSYGEVNHIMDYTTNDHAYKNTYGWARDGTLISHPLEKAHL